MDTEVVVNIYRNKTYVSTFFLKYDLNCFKMFTICNNKNLVKTHILAHPIPHFRLNI